MIDFKANFVVSGEPKGASIIKTNGDLEVESPLLLPSSNRSSHPKTPIPIPTPSQEPITNSPSQNPTHDPSFNVKIFTQRTRRRKPTSSALRNSWLFVCCVPFTCIFEHPFLQVGDPCSGECGWRWAWRRPPWPVSQRGI